MSRDTVFLFVQTSLSPQLAMGSQEILENIGAPFLGVKCLAHTTYCWSIWAACWLSSDLHADTAWLGISQCLDIQCASYAISHIVEILALILCLCIRSLLHTVRKSRFPELCHIWSELIIFLATLVDSIQAIVHRPDPFPMHICRHPSIAW